MHIGTGLKHLFRKDFATQCRKWRKEGDRLIVVMDASTYTMDGKPRKIIEDKGVGLVELSHKYWVAVLSNTYINGTIPVDAGDRSPDKKNYKLLHAIIHQQPW